MADPQEAQPAGTPPLYGASDVTPTLGPASLGSGSRLDLARSIINGLSGGGIPAIQERLKADYALRQQNAQTALNTATQYSGYKAHAYNSVDTSIDPATGQPRAPFGMNPVTGKPATAQEHQAWDNIIARNQNEYHKALPKDAKPIAQKLFDVVHHITGHKPPEGGGAAALPTAGDFGGETGRPTAVPPPPQPSATAGPAVPPPPGHPASQNAMEYPSIANPAVMAAPENQRMAGVQNKLTAENQAHQQELAANTANIGPETAAKTTADVAQLHTVMQLPPAERLPAMMRMGIFPPGLMKPTELVVPNDPSDPSKGNHREPHIPLVDMMSGTQPSAPLSSGWAQKVRSTTTPGGLTTRSVTTPGMAGKAGAGGSARTGGGRPAAIMPPAVAAAEDRIMMEGVPATGNLNDATSLAMEHLKKQGIDTQLMATTGSRSQAEVAGMIEPLIARARQLIAQDPKVLGPLAGRWSELAQKSGNLEGSAKELAGTLTSIYSLAVKMHGWRGSHAADIFRQQYGDLSNTPASLNAGLDAMQQTTHAIRSTVYPGQKGAAAPTGNVVHWGRDSSGKPVQLPAVQ